MLLASSTALALGATGASAAPLCEPPGDLAAARRLESADVVVLYRVVPAPIAVGQPFAVEAFVCPPPVASDADLGVDAYMPDHRHGMNYRPRVSRRADGRFVADGLLFHMPGHWQLRFDVARPAGRTRLADDIELE